MTFAVLAAFAFLTFLGLRDSSYVAITIFFVHALTLCLLILFCIISFIRNKGEIFRENYRMHVDDPVGKIFFGFCAGLLGITGFETSANYIEQQKPGKNFS